MMGGGRLVMAGPGTLTFNALPLEDGDGVCLRQG